MTSNNHKTFHNDMGTSTHSSNNNQTHSVLEIGYASSKDGNPIKQNTRREMVNKNKEQCSTNGRRGPLVKNKVGETTEKKVNAHSRWNQNPRIVW